MKRGAKLAGERTDDNGGFDWIAFLDLWWEIGALPSIGFFNMIIYEHFTQKYLQNA